MPSPLLPIPALTPLTPHSMASEDTTCHGFRATETKAHHPKGHFEPQGSRGSPEVTNPEAVGVQSTDADSLLHLALTTVHRALQNIPPTKDRQTLWLHPQREGRPREGTEMLAQSRLRACAGLTHLPHLICPPSCTDRLSLGHCCRRCHRAGTVKPPSPLRALRQEGRDAQIRLRIDCKPRDGGPGIGKCRRMGQLRKCLAQDFPKCSYDVTINHSSAQLITTTRD